MHPDDQSPVQTWIAQIPDEQWTVYQRVIRAAHERGIPFALGGAFALATHTGHWRNTKDLDFFVKPASSSPMIDLLADMGLNDYYEQVPYDRSWIYRAYEGDTIVDVIWAMANHRGTVDDHWLQAGPEVEARGERLQVLPAEEVLWNKLYILHRDRCDWPDVLNLIHMTGERLDWAHLLTRVGEDIPVLRGVLSLYSWLCPAGGSVAPWVWERIQLPQPHADDPFAVDQLRVDWLDSRPWFGPQRGES